MDGRWVSQSVVPSLSLPHTRSCVVFSKIRTSCRNDLRVRVVVRVHIERAQDGGDERLDLWRGRGVYAGGCVSILRSREEQQQHRCGIKTRKNEDTHTHNRATTPYLVHVLARVLPRQLRLQLLQRLGLLLERLHLHAQLRQEL